MELHSRQVHINHTTPASTFVYFKKRYLECKRVGGKDTDFPVFKVGGSRLCNCDSARSQENQLSLVVPIFVLHGFFAPIPLTCSSVFVQDQQSPEFQAYHLISPYVSNPQVYKVSSSLQTWNDAGCYNATGIITQSSKLLPQVILPLEAKIIQKHMFYLYCKLLQKYSLHDITAFILF